MAGMKSRATKSFWSCYEILPKKIQSSAKSSYRRFKQNPSHPSLQFKKVNENPPVFSVRISIHYRALGVKQDDTIIWFWIGDHTTYKRTIQNL